MNVILPSSVIAWADILKALQNPFHNLTFLNSWILKKTSLNTKICPASKQQTMSETFAEYTGEVIEFNVNPINFSFLGTFQAKINQFFNIDLHICIMQNISVYSI